MGDALDDIAALEELRRRAEDLSRRLAAGEREAAECSARDSHDAVRVVLSVNGRVASIEVFSHWRRQIAADELGAVIVEVADEAVRHRSETWAHGVAHTASVPARSPSPGAASLMASTNEPVDDLSMDYARNLFQVLRDAYARLDDLESETERAAPASTTASDAQGRVRVTLQGERLSVVRFNEVWLRTASAVQLGAVTTQAIRQAYNDRENAATLRNSWPYDELDRMTVDPAQLLASLGLAPRQTRRSS